MLIKSIIYKSIKHLPTNTAGSVSSSTQMIKRILFFNIINSCHQSQVHPGRTQAVCGRTCPPTTNMWKLRCYE